MKTRTIKPNEIEEKWFVVDAEGKRLGKVATTVASLLIDKENPAKVAYHESKVHVVVLNSKTVDIHPRKVIGKKYYRHTGFPGGLKTWEYGRLHSQRPNKVLELAIKGMLPKTRHQDKLMANLFVYEGSEHKQEAQKPKLIEVK